MQPPIVTSDSIQFAALAPLGFLMVADGPTSSYALWGMFLTLIAGLIGRWLDNRKEENRHKWEMEARAAQADAIRADLVAHSAKLADAMAEQTAKVDTLRTQLTQEHTENKGIIATGLAAVQRMDVK